MPDAISREIPVPATNDSPGSPALVLNPPAVGLGYADFPAALAKPINRLWILGGVGAALLLLALTGYGAIQILHPDTYIKVTGADSVNDFAAEQNYNTTYSQDASRILADMGPYAPTSTSPGVCNKGGTKQGCYDTDQKVTGDFRVMLGDLGRLTVPPRYKKADADLRSGLQLSIDGFILRDQAIASGDPNASFAASNQKLQQALVALHLANSEFPADNAPQPKF